MRSPSSTIHASITPATLVAAFAAGFLAVPVFHQVYDGGASTRSSTMRRSLRPVRNDPGATGVTRSS